VFHGASTKSLKFPLVGKDNISLLSSFQLTKSKYRLVCDQNGRWIIRFSKYLGNCTVTDAELWGILDGLKLILDRGFKRILIQTDSLEAAFAIQEGAFRISNSTLLRRIK
ncbi:hypothetical protein Gotur_035333, partial [Gossypium turneri]